MSIPESSRLEELFHRAADLPPADRAAFLDEHCADDPGLRLHLERLLRGDSESGERFMRTAARAESPGTIGGAVFEDCAGVRIGRYTLVRKIGEGGMGVVFEARQEHPARTVALKIVRSAMASPAMVRRFTHEAQILGQLQHPGIACIYEAGVAEVSGEGLVVSGGARSAPYFAMELVAGEPLTEYAAARNLGTRERLELFAGICDAVHHAHSKGIIHRDLKPANILVVDGETGNREQGTVSAGFTRVPPSAPRTPHSALPKVLDFGVARLTDADVQTVTLQTDVGQLVGTVPYMSPEQVVGDSRQLDARSDVYALGVILYELLAGKLPLDVSHRSIPEATRIIREEEPSRLSSVDTRFRGDIETIVAKALEKDRDRRYGSAAELAADVRRHLRVEPILARPASTGYRARKFVRRNKGLVAASAIVFVVLVAGVIGTSMGLVRARREARVAQSESAIARAVTEFLNKDLLAAVAPEEQGKDVTMREVLDEAAERIEGRFPNQPQVEAALRMTLGETYMRLGVLDAAEPHLTRALEVRMQTLGSNHPETRAASRWLAIVWNRQARYAEAERSLHALMERDCRSAPPDDEACMSDTHELGFLLVRQGRLREAETVQRELLEMKRRSLGPEHESTLMTSAEVGSLLSRLDRYDEAEPLIRQTLAAQRKVHGKEHTNTLFSLNNLAVLKRETGRLEESEALFNELLASMRQVFGPEHPYTLFACGDLCTVYERQKRFADAERLATSTLEALSRVLGPEHSETLITMEKLAQIHTAQAHWSDAEPVYARLVDAATRTGHGYAADFLRGQARVLAELSRYEEAEAALLRAAQPAGGAPERPVPPKTVQALVDLYEAWEKPAEAAKWRAKLGPGTASQPQP